MVAHTNISVICLSDRVYEYMFKCAYRNVAGQSYSTNGYYEMPKPEYLIRKADQATNLQIISNKVKQ
jgi:hypothetical protein